MQFVEFETKKNIDQQMDNTSRFLPFLRLGEIDHDLCNSHLFCVLPSSSNTNINKQSTEGKIKNPLIIFCFIFEEKNLLKFMCDVTFVCYPLPSRLVFLKLGACPSQSSRAA